MPHDLVCDVTRWLLEHDHRVLILKDAHAAGYDYLLVGDGELDPASLWWFERMGVIVCEAASAMDDLHPHDTVRAGAVACASRLKPLALQMRAAFGCGGAGERCFLQHWSAVTSSHAIGSPTHLLEVFHSNVSKWTMIESHCARAGIDCARIAAIGDGLNDVELIANAALGIAMTNSCAEVVGAAKRITDHHDADGVATAIDRLLSGEW